MTNFILTDKNGKKHQINEQQLQTLAAQGKIQPTTPLETDTGHTGLAGQIPGLFNAPPPQSAAPAQTIPQSVSVPAIKESKTSYRTILVVGLILVILAAFGLSIYVFNASRKEAQRMHCSNSMKEITLALHKYHDVYNAFPPLYTVDNNGKPLHSWRVLILPFIEQNVLYSEIRLDEPWDSEYNRQFHDRMPPNYQCPSNPEKGCCYSGIAGEIFVPAKTANSKGDLTFGSITDGTSNTIAIVEVKEPFCWMNPTADITLDELSKGVNEADGRVGSSHSGNGCNVGMIDGTTRFLHQTIDKAILRALGTIAGNESRFL